MRAETNRPSGWGPARWWPASLAVLLVLVGSKAFAIGLPETIGPGSVAYYVSAVSILAMAIAFNAALANPVGILYALLFLGLLGVMAGVEGHLQALFFPGRDELYLPVNLVIGFVAIAVGFYAGAAGLREARRPRFENVLRYLALASLGLAVVTPFWPNIYTANLANIFLMLMIIVQIGVTVTWRTVAVRMNRLSIILAVLSAIAAVWYILNVMLSGEQGAQALYRSLFFLVMTGTVAVMAFYIVSVRRDYARALKAELDAARVDAEKTRALFDAERNFARASEMASKRAQLLATASHDVRQPIISLRAQIEALSAQAKSIDVDGLKTALEHLDKLAGEYLREDDPTVSIPSEKACEPVNIQLIFDTLEQLFASEASAKGTSLTFVRTRAQANVPPLLLTRVLSNCISNAIAHASPCRIVIGVRHRSGNVRIDVIDNGPGLDAGKFDQLRARGAKGDDSRGSGLGLSIVEDLSSQIGASFSIRTAPGRGFACSVTLLRE